MNLNNTVKGGAGNEVKSVQKLAAICKLLQAVGGPKCTIDRTFSLTFALSK
jgi:hypothetical protein